MFLEIYVSIRFLHCTKYSWSKSHHAALFMSVHVWYMSEHACRHVPSLLPFCIFQCDTPLIINYFMECYNTIYSTLSLRGIFQMNN